MSLTESYKNDPNVLFWSKLANYGCQVVIGRDGGLMSGGVRQLLNEVKMDGYARK